MFVMIALRYNFYLIQSYLFSEKIPKMGHFDFFSKKTVEKICQFKKWQ